MTKLQASFFYGSIIGAIVVACWFVGVRDKEYDDCIIKNQSGYHLRGPRGPIREACHRNLNPFSGWVDE